MHQLLMSLNSVIVPSSLTSLVADTIGKISSFAQEVSFGVQDSRKCFYLYLHLLHCYCIDMRKLVRIVLYCNAGADLITNHCFHEL